MKSKAFALSALVLLAACGGGHKGMVLPENTDEIIKEFFGVKTLRASYGMTEQNGFLVTCEADHYHLLPWVTLFLLDLETGRPLPRQGQQTGRAIFDGTCEIFEAAGEATQRTKEDGKPLDHGFFHGLGHGVGLEVHEQPWLSRYPGHLVEGDVITLEPGLYRSGYGGCRLEDLVLVTKDGAEPLTTYPYDLQP